MNCTAIPSALSTQYQDRPLYSIPQRKARYSDKDRVRLREIKAAALYNLGLSSSREVRALLKEIGVSLDLRLTAAWCAINWELMPYLLAVLERKRLVKGAKVGIKNCPANLYFLAPFTIYFVDGKFAQLEYVSGLVDLDRLFLWDEESEYQAA